MTAWLLSPSCVILDEGAAGAGNSVALASAQDSSSLVWYGDDGAFAVYVGDDGLLQEGNPHEVAAGGMAAISSARLWSSMARSEGSRFSHA